MGDSKSGGDAAKSYDYYATFAAVLRAGPISTIHSILVDGKEIWAGPINRTDGGVGNPYTVVPTESKWVREGGYIKLYWGEDSQTTADAALALHGHPPYRGFAYIVFCRFLCGRERTNLPNIEVICEAEADPSAVITGTTVEGNRVNPWAVVADLLTSRHGLGLDPSMLDAASFQAAHDYLADDADRVTLSYGAPLLTQQTEFRTFCDGLVGAFGGLLRVNDSGEIEAVQPPLDPGSLSLYLQLDENDYSKAIEVDAQTWDDVPTGITLRYADADRQWKQSAMVHDDALALALVGESRRESIERDWVTSSEQARRLCAEWAKRACRPTLRGTAHIRSAAVLVHPTGSPVEGQRIRPGDRIRLDVDSTPGGSGSSQLVRVLEMRQGQKGGVAIRWEADVSSPQVPFAPEYTVPENSTPEPTEITTATVIPLPTSLSPEREPSVGVLASRPDDMVTGADVLFDVADGAGTFAAIGTQIGFAVPCRIASDYLETAAGDIRVELLNTRDQHLALTEPGDSGAANDQLLLIALATTTNLIDLDGDGMPVMEVMSISQSAAVSGDTYDFSVLRARHGTRQREWLEDSTCWIIPRSSLVAHRHQQFRARSVSGDEMTFRLRSFNRFSTYSGSMDDLPCVFPTNTLRAPVITFDTAQEITGSSGDWWPASGSVTDPDGNLVRVRMTAFRVPFTDSATTIFDCVIGIPVRTITVDDAATLAGLGTLNHTFTTSATAHRLYIVTLEAWDANGLRSKVTKNVVTPPTGAGTTIEPPEISWTGTTYTLSHGSATSILYYIDSFGGTALEGGSSPYPVSPTTISGSSGSFTRAGRFRVWVRAIGAGGESEWTPYDIEDPDAPALP